MTTTTISSATREVHIGFDQPFVVIGERINPTGRKILAEEMKNGDYSRVEADAMAQVEAGAHMLQVFEAMGMWISRPAFEKWAMPCMVKIATELKKRHPDVPLLVFPRGACYANAALQEAGYDVVTMDCETDAKGTRAMLEELAAASGASPASAIQGNLDPAILRPSAGSDEGKVKAAARQLLEDVGTQALIANLGEGLLGNEDPALVKALVDESHVASEEILAAV